MTRHLYSIQIWWVIR